MSLRPYQQDAFDAAKDWLTKTIDSCVIQAPTGAGKSHIIAAIADWIHHTSGKKHVLCIAPSAELVIQNPESRKVSGHRQSGFDLLGISRERVTAAPCGIWDAADGQEQDPQVWGPVLRRSVG